MEKPGISAYNKLKGPVMEFGYVTESGDKVRVRTMPADGLDHMAIQRHLNYVEQQYVDESKTLAAAGLKIRQAAQVVGKVATAPVRGIRTASATATKSVGDFLTKSGQKGLDAVDARRKAHAAGIEQSGKKAGEAWSQSTPAKISRGAVAGYHAAKDAMQTAGAVTRDLPAVVSAAKGAAAERVRRTAASAKAPSKQQIDARVRAAVGRSKAAREARPSYANLEEDTTYTRREVRKLRLLEAIREYGDTDA